MIEILLADSGQVGALGQELAQQAVGVLVTSPLPPRMWISEPHVDVRSLHQLGVARELGTAIVG
ncbi:hypothetical protein LA05_06270, partial [Xanthomonas oryzae pv. oryzae]